MPVYPSVPSHPNPQWGYVWVTLISGFLFQVSFEMFLRRIVISLCAKAASLFPLPETKVKLGQPFVMIFVVVPSPLTCSSTMCFEPALAMLE